MRRTIASGILSGAAVVLVGIYLLALLPVALLGLAAHADYGYRGCPGGIQCSDAASVRTLAAAYVFAAPIIWLLFKTLRAAGAALLRENAQAP